MAYQQGCQPSPHALLTVMSIHDFGSDAPAASVDRRDVDVEPLMYNNDDDSDCTCVAWTNLARGISRLNGADLTVDPAAPLRNFAAIKGVALADVATAGGAFPADVLNWQSARGFDIGPQSLVARSGIIPFKRSSLAKGIDRLGGLWSMIALRDREMQTADVWNFVTGRDDGPFVGYHMVNLWDYSSLADDGVVRLGTWARWQAVTWAWINGRLREAHGAVWRQLARPDGTFWNGLTADAMIAGLTP